MKITLLVRDQINAVVKNQTESSSVREEQHVDFFSPKC